MADNNKPDQTEPTIQEVRIFDVDVSEDELQRKAIGGYGGDDGESVLMGASKEPIEGERKGEK